MHDTHRFQIRAGRVQAACGRGGGTAGGARFLVVDDHGLVRRGLALALKARDAGCAVLEAGSLAQALRHAAGTPLSAVLYDLQLGDASGVSGLRRMLEAAGQAPVIVVSGSLDSRIVGDCLRAGARGVLPKSCNADVLDHALPLVLGGGVYAPMAVMSPLAEREPPRDSAPDRFSQLTERQRAVLVLLMGGRSNKEIAREMGVLEGTVKVHLRAIMQKLRVRNRTQLALVAAGNGALPHA